MTVQQKDSGPAFPNIARDMMEGERWRWVDGLSKRELFAAMAMQGLVTNLPKGFKPKDIAWAAVAAADALLEELE